MSKSRPDPVLPTAVVGSYSMPGWLERVKNDYLHRRISPARPRGDPRRGGEGGDQGPGGGGRRRRLRRRAAPGQHDRPLHDPAARRADRPRVEEVLLRLLRLRGPRAPADRVARARRGVPLPPALHRAPRPRSRSPGPLSLVKRIRNEYYPSEEALALDIARVMNVELRELVRAGATRHPDRRALLLGLPRGPALGGAGAQRPGRGRRGAAVASTSATGTATESRPGRAATATCSRRSSRRASTSSRSSSPGAARTTSASSRSSIRRSRSGSASSTSRATTSRRRPSSPSGSGPPSSWCPPRALAVNPDCGLMHLPRDVAFAKLSAMVEGTRLVRAELGG